jgi:hypothetical protein
METGFGSTAVADCCGFADSSGSNQDAFAWRECKGHFKPDSAERDVIEHCPDNLSSGYGIGNFNRIIAWETGLSPLFCESLQEALNPSFNHGSHIHDIYRPGVREHE